MIGPWPARITCTAWRTGSTRRLNGTPSAAPSAQRVSTLGLPVPDSSWDRVDLAIPARRASSVRDGPAPFPADGRRNLPDQARRHSTDRAFPHLFAPEALSFVLTNHRLLFIIID